jgi:hypothetical protein
MMKMTQICFEFDNWENASHLETVVRLLRGTEDPSRDWDAHFWNNEVPAALYAILFQIQFAQEMCVKYEPGDWQRQATDDYGDLDKGWEYIVRFMRKQANFTEELYTMGP